jgi:membrane protein
MGSLKAVFAVIAETWHAFDEDQAPRLAASLAYYVVFSIAPLLIVATAIAGALFDAVRVRQEVFAQLQGLVGDAGAQATYDIMQHANMSRGGLLATVLGAVAILVGAGGVFEQLRHALDVVWGVRPKKAPFLRGFLKEHVFSLALVVGSGFLLLVSLLVNAGVAALVHAMHDRLPGSDALWQGGYYLLATLAAWVVFAFAFKVIPDVRVPWRDILRGAGWTAILFSLGQALLGVYLGRGSFGNAYGAAGSFVVLLVWIYYSSQVFLLGAELTKVLARRRGALVPAKPGAELVAAGPSVTR